MSEALFVWVYYIRKFLAVQYNSDTNSFVTWLDKLKTETPIVKKEIGDFFEMANMKGLKLEELSKVSNNVFDKFCKDYKIADSDLKQFLKTWDGAGDIFQAFQQYLKNTQGGLTGFSGALSKAQGVLKGFGAALGSMGINWAIGEVIGFAANAIDDYIHRAERIKEAAEQSKSAIDSIKSNFNSLKSTVNDSSQRFAELAQGVDNLGKSNQSRGNLSTEQYKEFLGLSNQLADLFPRLTTGYDENGNAILNLSGNIDTIVSSLNSLTEAEQIAANQDILKEMPNVWAGFSVDTSQYKKSSEEARQQLNNVHQILKTLNNPETAQIDMYGTGTQNRLISKALKSIGIEYGDETFKKIRTEGSNKWDLSVLDNNQLMHLQNVLAGMGKEYEDTIQKSKDKIEEFKSDISGYINTWLSTDNWNFSNLDSGMQKAVKDILLNSSWTDSLPKNISGNWDKVATYLEENFLYAIRTIDNEQLETALTDIFNGNFTTTSLRSVIEDLKTEEGFDNNNPLIIYLQEKLQDDTAMDNPKNHFKEKSEFTNGISNSNHNQEIDRFASEYKVSSDEFEKLAQSGYDQTTDITTLTDALRELRTETNAIQDSNLTFSEAWDSISVDSSLTSELFDLASSGELTGKKLKELADNNTVLKSAMDSTALSANKFAESISELNIKNIDSDINVLTNSLTKLKNGQTLSLEDASKLIAIDNSLAGSVKKVGDGYKIEEDALNGVIDKQKEKYNAAVTNEINETQNTIDRINNRINGYKTEIKALKEVISSRDSIGGTASGSYSDTLAMIELQKKRRKTKKRLNKNNKKLEGLLDSLNNTSSNPKDTTKDKTQSTAKIFNWIETRISRLERRISKATSKAEDSYRSFEKRAKSYSKAIRLTTDEIKTQEKAADKYFKKADKSKLSDNLKKKVKNGTIDIQKIKDEKTQKQVEEYQENWEKYLAHKDEADNLRQKKKQYRRDKIELENTKLDESNESLESENNLISENIEHSKERGQFDLSGNYKQQIANNQKQVGNIEEQNKNLEKLKKTVAEGSEAWNGYESRIQSNNESINSLKHSNAELAEAMYNLPIEERDSLLEEYDSKDELLNAKSENALSAGEKNQYSDEIIANIKSRQSVRQNAVEGTKDNVLSNIPAGGGNDVYDKIQSCISSGQPIGKDLISAVSGNPDLYYACKAYNEALLAKMLYDETSKADIQSQLSSQRDNIESSANEQLESISADETKLQADISKSEAAGLSQSKAQSTEQIRLSKEREKALQNEHSQLENWLNDMMAAGEIIEGDEQYEKTQNDLKNIEADLINCTADEIKFNSAIKEMDLSRLEKLVSLLDVAKNRLAGLASLAESHGHNASDDLLLKQIEASFTETKTYKDMMEESLKSLRNPENLSQWGISKDLMEDLITLVQNGKVNDAEQILKDKGIDIENLTAIHEEFNKIASSTSSYFSSMVDGEKYYDSLIQNRIDMINEYLDGLQKEKDLKDRTLALEKARFALEKAKNNLTKKVWNGSQWVYTADTEAVQSAQEAYDDAEYEELTNSLNDLVDVLERLMKDHNLYDDNGNLTENGEEVKRVISDIDAKEFPNVLKALIERGFSEEELTSIAKSNGVDISSQMHSDVLQSLMDNIRANPDMTKWLYDYENFPAPQINIPNVYDTANLASLTSAQQNNIPQSAMPVPQFNIQNTAVPDFTLPAASGAGAVHVDKVDIILPNINDNSKAYDLAMSLRNELMSLRTYSQQYNWNQ